MTLKLQNSFFAKPFRKERVSANVIFCSSGLDSLDASLAIPHVPEDFKNFCSALGWGHPDPEAQKSCIYWASQAEEIEFHSPYYRWQDEMKADEFLSQYKSVVKEDAVHVIWMQTNLEARRFTVSLQQQGLGQFYICINPLNDGSGLYRIKVICSTTIQDDSVRVTHDPFANTWLIILR